MKRRVPQSKHSEHAAAMLAKCTPALRPVAERLHQMLSDSIDGVVESWDGENFGLGDGPGYKGLIFVIMPQKQWITFGISHAATLPDPSKLLEGKGKVHRHIKLRSRAEVEAPAVRQLVDAALLARAAR